MYLAERGLATVAGQYEPSPTDGTSNRSERWSTNSSSHPYGSSDAVPECVLRLVLGEFVHGTPNHR